MILRLFRAYPGADSKVSRATVDTYLKAIDFFPARLVDIAVEQFLTGQVQRDQRNRPFVPSADELATQVRTIRYEEGKTQRLLQAGRLQIEQRDKDADVDAARTPEAMAKVKSMMEAFTESVSPKQKTPAEIAKAKDDLHRLDIKFEGDFEERIPGVKVSSYLISKLTHETFDSADDDAHDLGGIE